MNQNDSSVPTYWRKCTTCKKPIGFQQRYWVCSVSTCNRIRTGLVFCDLRCFDAHVPVMNHRDAGAFEKTSITLQAWKAEHHHHQREEGTLKQRDRKDSAVTLTQDASLKRSLDSNIEREILVVVSKVKDYIRSQSGMNTSVSTLEFLSNYIRGLADQAIERARLQGRKTILDRDIPI